MKTYYFKLTGLITATNEHKARIRLGNMLEMGTDEFEIIDMVEQEETEDDEDDEI